MAYQFIKFERVGGKAELTLNRPPENRLNAQMVQEILDALENLRDDESLKLLVLRGTNGTFCSGTETEALQADEVGLLMPYYTRIFKHLNKIMGLTLCIVEGNALDAGTELAAFCDVILSSESAVFGFPQIKMGLFPPIGTAVLPRLIGRNRTLDRIVSGEPFSAQEAFRMDLVARVVPDNKIQEVAAQYIARINSLPAPAIILAKRAVDGALYTPVMEALRSTESVYMLDLMGSIDPNEGIRAALEGREPQWRNR